MLSYLLSPKKQETQRPLAFLLLFYSSSGIDPTAYEETGQFNYSDQKNINIRGTPIVAMPRIEFIDFPL